MTEQVENPFAALLEEVGELAKAQSAECEKTDDGKIEAAAEEGDEDDDKDDGEMVAKSFEIVLEDGTKVPAMDGSVLIKALTTRIEKNEGTVLEALQGAVGVIKQQGDLIKSLQTDFAAFKDKGVGRKAVLTVHERPAAKTEDALVKSEEGMGAEEFMAKAMGAQAAGKIGSQDIAILEAHINRNLAPPAEIVRRVLA